MVFDHSLPKPNKETRSHTSNGGTTMATATMVFFTPNVERSSPPIATQSHSRPSTEFHQPGVHNELGSANIGRMAHLRESFAMQGISSQATDLLFSLKTKNS